MEDKSQHNSVSDIGKPGAAGSATRPSTTINDNARNPDGQNHTMQGCKCEAWYPPEMPIDRPIAVDPYSQIGARKYEH